MRRAREDGALRDVHLHLVDNGAPSHPSLASQALAAWPADLGAPRVKSGHGNVGYGTANNLVLADLDSDIHLVMNPDVELEEGAIAAVLGAFDAHPEVGVVAPAVFGADGARQYLCKRYPSVWVLVLRAFAPKFAHALFRGSLDRYEMRDAIADKYVGGIPIASGCFMALRTALFRRVGGFDPGYFLYFEDFDLSLRAAREADIAYVPAARITHRGGGAASKGPRHMLWFARSARRFFSRHGWKLV